MKKSNELFKIIAISISASLVILLSGCNNQSSSTKSDAEIKITDISKKLPEKAYGGVDGINDVVLPKEGTTIYVKGDVVKVAGHYVDQVKGDAAQGVIVLINEMPYITIYGGERPDLVTALNNPKYLRSQFYVEIPKKDLKPGLNDLKVRVIASDGSGYYESDLIARLKAQ